MRCLKCHIVFVANSCDKMFRTRGCKMAPKFLRSRITMKLLRPLQNKKGQKLFSLKFRSRKRQRHENSDLEIIQAQLSFANVKKDKRNLGGNIYFPEKYLTNVFIKTLLCILHSCLDHEKLISEPSTYLTLEIKPCGFGSRVRDMELNGGRKS